MNNQDGNDPQGVSRLLDILSTMEPERARHLLRETADKLS